MRNKLLQIYEQIDQLKEQQNKLTEEYISSYSNYYYVSDHALVRYIERVENILLLGNTDEEKLLSYPGDTMVFRKKAMPIEIQLAMLEHKRGWHKHNNLTYITRGLTLVTIIKAKNNDIKQIQNRSKTKQRQTNQL